MNNNDKPRTYTIDDLKKQWDFDERWQKAHPFLCFPENCFDFFRYRIPNYYDSITQSIKFAYQRVVRGYDDGWHWGYYYEDSRQTLKILKWMQEHKHGSPYTTDPDNVLTTPDTPTDSDGVNDDWHKRWEEALQIMIEGFEAVIEMEECHELDENGEYDPEKTKLKREELNAKWIKGATLFIHNYQGLWD